MFPIVVAQKNLDLGAIWATTDYSWTLHLQNTSPRQVELAELRANCKCLSVEPLPLTIPAKQQFEVTLRLDVSTPPDDKAEIREPNFRVRVIPIVTGYRGRPPQWELTGTIRKLLSLSRSSVRFEETLIQGQPFPVQTVDILGAVPLQSLEVEGGEALATLDVAKKSDTRYVLSIRPHENVPPGQFSFDVKLISQLPCGERIRTSAITVNGLVSREVEPSPRSVHFGIAPIGRTLQSRVVVHSLVGKPFTIKSISADSENTQVKVEESTEDTKTLLIKQRIAAAGDQQNSVTVVVENYGGEAFQLAIPISYHGFADED